MASSPFSLKPFVSGQAKDANIAVANGKALTGGMLGSKYLQDLSSESRLLRWLACSQLAEMHKALVQKNDKTWTEATVFHYFCGGD